MHEELEIKPLEILSIEVRKLSSKPFVITTWYRPPNSSVDLFFHFDTVLRKLDSENVEHYLMGDLNSDLLSENNTYALRQLITEPTRITPSSCSLLDVIFTFFAEIGQNLSKDVADAEEDLEDLAKQFYFCLFSVFRTKTT